MAFDEAGPGDAQFEDGGPATSEGVEDPVKLSSKTPVYVVAGYLGSGKTTLLARLVSHELTRGGLPGVIMNEAGAVDVDGRVLHECSDGEIDVHALLGGCVCCDLSTELTGAVQGMLDAGRATKVFVETTGLADAGQAVDGVRRALDAENGGRGGFLAGVILVVDTPRFDEIETTLFPAAARLRSVTSIVLNKIDLDGRRLADGLESRFRASNRFLRIYRATRGEVPAEMILRACPTWSDAGSAISAAAPENSSAGFSTISCQIEPSVDEHSLHALLSRYPSIQRSKGCLRFSGRDGPHEFQWVPGQFEVFPPQAEPDGRRNGTMVVIGKRVPWNRFLAALEGCLVRERRKSPVNRKPS